MKPKQLTYEAFIQQIIYSRGQWTQLYDKNNQPVPYENHHIIPRCMGGEPCKIRHNQIHPNLIWLTLEEHFTAHKLLATENPDNDMLVSAFSCMMQYGGKQHASEEDYALNKKLLTEASKTKWHASIEARTQTDWDNSINKRRNTNLKKYGNENYCNQKQRVTTLKNKSDEEKHITYLKWFASNFNKPESELLLTRQKKRDGHLNRSEEAKELTRQKYRDTLSKLPAEYWIKKVEKSRETYNNKSDEEKQRIHENRSKCSRGANNPRAIPIHCVNTGEYFGCIKDASTKYGVSLYCIKKSLKEHTPDIQGNMWEYK